MAGAVPWCGKNMRMEEKMDPNANWEELLQIATTIIAAEEACSEADIDRSGDADAIRLAELVLALNEWIQKGGFLPAAWKKG
jgi:hypothetical protein